MAKDEDSCEVARLVFLSSPSRRQSDSHQIANEKLAPHARAR